MKVSEEEYKVARRIAEKENITTEEAAHWLYQFGIKYLNGKAGQIDLSHYRKLNRKDDSQSSN